jgi:EmrB/QacA subfamily drug resistance transporter
VAEVPGIQTLSGWRRLLVEPARPTAIREHRGAAWFAMGAVCVGAFLGQLDASIVTVALPTLQHRFHAGVTAVSWVALTYLLVLVAALPAIGRMADMVGRKLLYVYGFVLFTAGSALCAVAPNLLALDGCRALQALGAALLQANSVAIIVDALPSRLIGRGIGVQGAAQALGLSLGPLVGGALLALGGWRLIFLVAVPFGILGAVAAVACIPRSRHLQPREPFDVVGLALFVPAIVGVVLAISLSATWGLGSPPVLGLVLAAVACAAAFIRHERAVAAPMVPPALLRWRRMGSGLATALVAYLVLFGVLLVVPFTFERALGLGPAQAGLGLMAMPLALAAVAPIAPRIAESVGASRVMASGLCLAALALVALGLLGPGFGVNVALIGVVGAGMGLFIPLNNAGVMRGAPADRVGVASGVLNTTRGIGTALGLAVTAALFDAAGGVGAAGAHHASTVTLLVLGSVALVGSLVVRSGQRLPER